MTEQLPIAYYIYKIVCKDPNVKSVYVGSTTNFKRRSKAHKNNCNNEKGKEYNYKLYKTVRNNNNWDNWVMSIISIGIGINKQEKLIKERYYIDLLNANLNIRTPYLSNEEIKQCGIDYYNNNKETITRTHKNYYNSNKETISKVQKDYYNSNQEKLNNASKDRYKKARLQKVNCECGHVYRLPNKTNHLKTKYHQTHINTTILCKTEIE